MSLELLKSNTDKLLHNDDPAMIYSALENIHYIFSEITNVHADKLEEHHNKETHLIGGKAISPYLAARCLLDPLRTVQFLRGIHAAIHEMFHRFPGESIHIVYAGCGPYATLLLPLTTQFTPEQIKLTLIDIHKPSIDGVRRLIQTFALEPYIFQCIQTDAVTYCHPPEIPLHMVVSETMQAGLAQEPQLAIMRNFLPQLRENGLFIPELIAIEASLSDSANEDIGLRMHRDKFGYPIGRGEESQTERLALGNVLLLNSKSAHPDAIGYGWDTIPLATVEVPTRDEQFDQFLLLTRVSIFGSYGFVPYDCELSFPQRLHDLTEVASGRKIQFSYVFDPAPSLHYELIVS